MSCLESSCRSAFLVSYSSSWRVVVISSSFFQDGTHIYHRRRHVGLLGWAYIIVSAVLVIPSSQWACAVLFVVIAPGEAPSGAPVVRRLWQAPTSAFAPGRIKDRRRWSANRRRRNQRCQLRARSRRRGDRRRPLCAWRRQGRSPKRRDGQRTGISWPVVIIGLLEPGTELGIDTTKWD